MTHPTLMPFIPRPTLTTMHTVSVSPTCNTLNCQIMTTRDTDEQDTLACCPMCAQCLPMIQLINKLFTRKRRGHCYTCSQAHQTCDGLHTACLPPSPDGEGESCFTPLSVHNTDTNDNVMDNVVDTCQDTLTQDNTPIQSAPESPKGKECTQEKLILDKSREVTLLGKCITQDNVQENVEKGFVQESDEIEDFIQESDKKEKFVQESEKEVQDCDEKEDVADESSDEAELGPLKYILEVPTEFDEDESVECARPAKDSRVKERANKIVALPLHVSSQRDLLFRHQNMVLTFSSDVVDPPTTFVVSSDKNDNNFLILQATDHVIFFHVDDLPSARVHLQLEPSQGVCDLPHTLLQDGAQMCKSNSARVHGGVHTGLKPE